MHRPTYIYINTHTHELKHSPHTQHTYPITQKLFMSNAVSSWGGFTFRQWMCTKAIIWILRISSCSSTALHQNGFEGRNASLTSFHWFIPVNSNNKKQLYVFLFGCRLQIRYRRRVLDYFISHNHQYLRSFNLPERQETKQLDSALQQMTQGSRSEEVVTETQHGVHQIGSTTCPWTGDRQPAHCQSLWPTWKAWKTYNVSG